MQARTRSALQGLHLVLDAVTVVAAMCAAFALHGALRGSVPCSGIRRSSVIVRFRRCLLPRCGSRWCGPSNFIARSTSHSAGRGTCEKGFYDREGYEYRELRGERSRRLRAPNGTAMWRLSAAPEKLAPAIAVARVNIFDLAQLDMREMAGKHRADVIKCLPVLQMILVGDKAELLRATKHFHQGQGPVLSF